ncbi:MAG: hypothetical protein H6766_04805 [Candidatus Peribacteria bacterium]|nr:MAG: hypothetical protein H6766_04805 [Candidatus Peribacteria bacterium]
MVAITVMLIFLRQVVGLNVFSIYYPILGAISLLLVGNKLFMIFFVIAWLSHWITYFASRKFHILVHAKIGIYLTIYTILSITALWAMTIIDPTIQRSYVQNIGTWSVITGFFSIAIVGQKVFENKKNLIRHATDIITYLIVMIPITLILDAINIQYWMITHTWVVFFAIIAAFVMGRFTGMKLLEYKRFGKLLIQQIKK